jgi:16S rRNA (cytosine1402-N4)-methyltransferase
MRTRLIPSSSDLVPATVHQSVLLHEAIEELSINSKDVVVDGTLGGAGHAHAIAGILSKDGTFIGFDLDSEAIARAETALKDVQPKCIFVETNFRNIETELVSRGITHIDKAIFDLGWSAYQLEAGRGFSFLKDEPLLMTYSSNKPDSNNSALTAAIIVNNWGEESIADIIFGWGEERYSRRIAKAIVERRVKQPFVLATDLANVIKIAVPAVYRFGRLHPATRTFQALRIAVNDELGALKDGLMGAWKLLSPGGRIAVITFHSIEDRIVKEMFLEWEREGEAVRITRSPKKGSKEEIQVNPRARSAKLRVVEKISKEVEISFSSKK